MSEATAKVVLFLFVVLICFGVGLLVIWPIWALWTLVLMTAWPTGPEAIVNPGYWLFVGEWVLLAVVARMFRGSK